MLAIPLVLVVLVTVWMQLVKVQQIFLQIWKRRVSVRSLSSMSTFACTHIVHIEQMYVHIYKCKSLSTFPQVRGQGKTGLDFEEAYNVSAFSSSENYSYADHLYIEPRTLEQMRLTVEQNWRRMKSRRSVLWKKRGRRRRRRTEKMIGGDQKPKVLSKNSECIVQCTTIQNGWKPSGQKRSQDYSLNLTSQDKNVKSLINFLPIEI